MNSSSPAPSPKRKRSEDSDNVPELDNITTKTTSPTEMRENSAPPEANSPRMGVTEKLKGLNLKSGKGVGVGMFTKEPSAPRKRLKKTAPLSSSSRAVVEIPFRSNRDLPRPSESSDGVVEVTNCRKQGSGFSTKSPTPTADLAAASYEFQTAGNNTKATPRTPSPHLHINQDSTHSTSPAPDPLPRSVSPLPIREDLTPDQAALTWQEDEITGHEIDAAAEDDGEGINGIGFKPTPAIAYARQQKRKQQVNEYKTREAREARQKRLQRRRGAVGEALDEAKRMVRFAGVG